MFELLKFEADSFISLEYTMINIAKFLSKWFQENFNFMNLCKSCYISTQICISLNEYNVLI